MKTKKRLQSSGLIDWTTTFLNDGSKLSACNKSFFGPEMLFNLVAVQ